MESTTVVPVASVEELWNRWCECERQQRQEQADADADADAADRFMELVTRSVQTTPPLAAQEFQLYDSNAMFVHVQVMPFHLLLLARAPLPVLKQVYDLYPQVLQQELVIYQGHFHGLPLHWACRYGCSSEVMDFLIEAHPEPLYHRHDFSRMPVHGGGAWPLHMAFASKVPSRHLIVPQQHWHTLATFSKLWQAGPKQFVVNTQVTGNRMSGTNPQLGSDGSTRTNRQFFSWTPLEWAIYTHQSMDIQAYFVEQFLFQCQQQPPPHEETGTVPNVQKLEILLGDHHQRQQHRVITPAAWNVLLQGLETNTSVTCICIKGLSVAVPEPMPVEIQSRQGTENPTKGTSEDDAEESLCWWNALASFLSKNTTLQEMEITAASTTSATAAAAAVTPTPTANDGGNGHDDDDADIQLQVRTHHRQAQQSKPFLHYVAKGLLQQQQSALVSLTLQGFTFPTSHVLCQLLCQQVTLQTLKLQGVRMTCEWNEDDADESDDDSSKNIGGKWRPSPHLERIVLGTAEISPLVLQGILAKLAQLPSLADLTMWIQYQEEQKQTKSTGSINDNATDNNENEQSDVAAVRNSTHQNNSNNDNDNPMQHPQQERQHNEGFDFTASLANLVRQQNRLQTLFFACKEKQGPARAPHRQLDLERFCQVALNNSNATSLQRLAFTGVPGLTLSKIKPLLETLQYHNATLIDIPTQLWVINHDDATTDTTTTTLDNTDNDNYHNPVDYQNATKTIFQNMGYWLQLNQYGRAQARDSETTKEQLVELLCHVVSSTAANDNSNLNRVEPRSRNHHETLDPFVIHYGLLREMPSIWC